MAGPAMAMAAKTWKGEWWKYGGGGTPWDGIAYDPESDLVYVGTGNGSPWSRDHRSQGSGDNLYLSSIVALRPDTGQYLNSSGAWVSSPTWALTFTDSTNPITDGGYVGVGRKGQSPDTHTDTLNFDNFAITLGSNPVQGPPAATRTSAHIPSSASRTRPRLSRRWT